MEFEGVGIGVSDFKMLRMYKNYFIDKSLYIKDIIDNQAGVHDLVDLGRRLT